MGGHDESSVAAYAPRYTVWTVNDDETPIRAAVTTYEFVDRLLEMLAGE